MSLLGLGERCEGLVKVLTVQLDVPVSERLFLHVALALGSVTHTNPLLCAQLPGFCPSICCLGHP